MTAAVNFAKEFLRLGSESTIIAVLIIGAVLILIRPRWGRRWVVAFAAVYWLLSTPAVSRLLVAPLAAGYGPIETPQQAKSAGAIVILGGGSRTTAIGSDVLAAPTEEEALRTLEAVRVYRLLGGRVPVVASGGSPGMEQRRSDGDVMADALLSLGVPRAHIIIERDSLNTLDEARLVPAMLNARGVHTFVLVTSPMHMRRSIAIFHAQGADVIPSTAALQPDNSAHWRFLIPNGDSLELSDSAVYEYAALTYYWLRGALRPAPASHQ
jgi:uncharacterized SAM-binding protein YcdF (DUF218 family)